MRQLKTLSTIGAALVLMLFVSLPAAAQGTGIMNITGGKVGIGTDNPSVKLHILEGGTPFPMSNVIAFALQNDPPNGGLVLSLIGGEPSGNAQMLFGTQNKLNAGGLAYYHGPEAMTFWTDRAERVRITANGDFGIGTVTPAGKLDVNGLIYQRGGVVHPDFVFEPDYQLLTIDQQSEYMWANKHLPSVGPGRYDDEGRSVIELGANSAAMLEELEKAHIYIAQLHERLQKLEGALASLNSGD